MLAPVAPREYQNPFGGTKGMLVDDRLGSADVVFDGKPIGAIDVGAAFVDDGELDVFSPEEPSVVFKEAVSRIAGSLGAEVEWFDAL